jgi:hypothetical protein
MCQQKISLSEKRQLRRCGRHPDHLIFARGEIPKDVHQPILALVQGQTRLRFYGIESLLCQYCVQDFDGLRAPYVYNGSELKLVWGIVDNRNGNEVTSIF